MVTEVIDPLVIVHMNVIKIVSYPAYIGPVYIPISVTVSLLPTGPRAEHIEDGIVQ